MERADRASAITSIYEKMNGTQSVVDLAMGRLNREDLAMRAAMGLGPVSDSLTRAAGGLSATSYMEEHTRLLALTRTTEFQSTIERAMQGFALVERNEKLLAKFMNPTTDIERLSSIAALNVPSWQSSLMEKQGWESVLSDRMGRLNVDWALAGATEASADAFARLGRLADVARYGAPYSDEAADALLVEIGTPTGSPEEIETVEEREVRYDDVGRERELIAFPPVAYSQILVSAGYAVSFPAPPPLMAIGGLIEPVRYSPETGELLQSLEAHLRHFVVTHLKSAVGRAWLKQRVPFEMREKWKAMAVEAEAEGKPVFEPIHYANFMDLFDIIARKDNWPLFSAAFRSRENLQMSMLRAYSIRNDVAHSRPISMTDELIATTESTMLFRAIGLTVNYNH